METKFVDQKIVIKTSLGSYEWCNHNTYEISPQFYLTQLTKNENKQMLDINLLLDQQLLKNISMIEISDHNSIILDYTKQIVYQPEQRFRFVVNDKLVGTNIIIRFIDAFNSKKIVFEQIIVVPKIKIIGDSDVCTICTNKILSNSNSKYIAQCGHVFCYKCLFKFLEENELLYKLHSLCEITCKHSNLGDFTCPKCKVIVTP